MSERMPVVFVSHGAPNALLEAPDTVACWAGIGRQIPEPSAILAVSAHWEALRPTASLAAAPETIHDFHGFAPSLYQIRYRAPGAPALAERAAALLSGAGLAAGLDPGRGLDHGAWVPLSVMYPGADVPVTQLSLVSGTGVDGTGSGDAGPATHFEIGRALAPLRDEGVLIVCSGAITHNFSWINWQTKEGNAQFPQARTFTDWVAESLAAQDVQGLLAYRDARYGAESHPTEDHFMPLFVALGAALDDTPVRYQPRFTYGGLAMDAYLWKDAPRPAG
jgi:4,5-DOPA dioxygenase extradiol